MAIKAINPLFISILIFWAATASSLTLDDVLNSVDQHYPEVLGADARARAQEALITRARGAFDPMLYSGLDRTNQGSYQNTDLRVGVKNQIPGTPVKVGAEWNDLDGKVPSYEGERVTGSDGRYKGFVEVPLLRDLVIDKARAGVQTALFRHAEALEEARLVRLDTYRIAAFAYWNWVSAAEKQKVYENLLAIAEERDKVVSTRVRRGESARIDSVDNQRIIMQRRAQLEKAKLEAQKAMLTLSLFYRTPNGAPVRAASARAPEWLRPLNEDITEKTEGLRDKLDNHPMLQALQQSLEQKRVYRRLARYNVLPELDFKLTHGEYAGNLPTPRDLPMETTVGFRFSFPLFNREARGANTAAKLEVDASEQKLTLAKQKLEVDFEKSALEANTSAAIYRFIYQEIGFAAQVETAERTRFQQGDSSLLNVNFREQDTALARVRAIEALLDFNEKDLELKLISNTWVRTY
jgi:outer membrane protein TolC